MASTCLGEGSYSARFVRRRTLLGPAVILGEAPVLSGSWSRKLAATTDASAVFGTGEGCDGVLAQLDPWRDELELHRETAESLDLVWAGPLLDVIANPQEGTATVTAQDLSAWWAKRRLPTIVSRQLDIAQIFSDYIAACFVLDDPGISIDTSPVGVLADRTVAAADLKMLDGELNELARSGVDWTVAGRTFFVGGQEISAHRIPGRLVDEHFRSAPQTRRSGQGQVNDAATRGNAVQGQWGGPDPSDGVLLQGTQEENAIEDAGSATASARTWWDRAHEPLRYVEGDNALDPSAPLDVQQLIAGLRIFADLSGGGVVPVQEEMRLESVGCSFSPTGEELSIALQPRGTTEGF